MPIVSTNMRLYRLLMMGLLLWLSSFAAVCVTSGGIALLRSDSIEVAAGQGLKILALILLIFRKLEMFIMLWGP